MHMHIWRFNLQRRRTNVTEVRGLWQRHVPHVLRDDQLPAAFPKGTFMNGGARRPPFLRLPADHKIGEEAAVVQVWR